MDDFINRTDAQRRVLLTVNRVPGFAEELCGLSRKAIERWLSVNRIDSRAELATILFQISSKLFFLSNKSQEQVTEEYRTLSLEVESLTLRLRERVSGSFLDAQSRK